MYHGMYCKDCDVRWAEEEGPECWCCDKVPAPKPLESALLRTKRTVEEALLAARVEFNAGTGS